MSIKGGKLNTYDIVSHHFDRHNHIADHNVS